MPEVEHAVSLNHFMDWFAGEGVATVGDNHIKAKGMFASKDLFNVFSYKLIRVIKMWHLQIKTVW
jgi:hypothetical protein